MRRADPHFHPRRDLLPSHPDTPRTSRHARPRRDPLRPPYHRRHLAASSAVSEFAKGAGKTAFDALKARLTGPLGARSVELIDHAAENPALEPAIKADLAKPAITADPEVRALAQRLEIEALPQAETAPYAIRIREIRAGRNLLFENVAGVQADIATAEGDMTFRDISPPGKR